MDEKLTAQLVRLRKALTSFQEVLGKEDDLDVIRDASIQRFDYCVEICWKSLKGYLEVQEGLLVIPLKSVSERP
ncbi:MAG: nucleotidyltransferase substrate binding protein [Candidatus Dojkabacteria bacterium]|nr:nucleotidyltransferase substrate binding protein [Candidatus Dojkabacteria bacterium]